MLVFHTAYTHKQLIDLGLEIFVQSRDAGKFFEKIITVNPIASLQYVNGQNLFGSPETFYLDDRNIIIEGKTARFDFLQRFEAINFFLAQLSLLMCIFRQVDFKNVLIVRAEDARYNGVLGLIASKLLRKPFIVGVWGNPGRLRMMNDSANMPRLFKTPESEARCEKYVLNRADMVLAQNQENLEYAITCGVEKSKTALTELGVGIDRVHFIPVESRNADLISRHDVRIGEELILVCVSRLEKSKMVDHAIKATFSLQKAGIPFKLYIAGDGRELENLQKLVKSFGMSDKVFFLGNKSQEWLSSFFVDCDIAIAPLCGRSLLETSLAGIPVVAYDIDWHNVLVKNLQTGILVPSCDVSEFGDRVLQLAQDPNLREILGRNLMREAEIFANPREIARRQVGIYSTLTRSIRN